MMINFIWMLTGAFVGGFIGLALGLGKNGGFMALVLSVIGAIIVLFIYEFATGKRRIR